MPNQIPLLQAEQSVWCPERTFETCFCLKRGHEPLYAFTEGSADLENADVAMRNPSNSALEFFCRHVAAPDPQELLGWEGAGKPAVPLRQTQGRGVRSPTAARLLVVLLLLAWCATAQARGLTGSLSVEMPGRPQIAYVNDSVTLSCQVPGCPSLDTRIMGVTWYQKDLVSEAEVKVLELYGDQQKAFRRGAMVSAQKLKRGDASLQLPGVRLGDAGEYRCELTVTPQKAKGWVLLEVLAKPDSTVFLEKTKVSGEGRHLVCQSSGFYPEAINITWEKWTQKVPQHQGISKDICTGPTIKNKDGVFSITSYLKINASLEDNGTIYQCVVEHPSLSISQRVNFTLLVIEAEKIYLTWILVFSFFGLILMLFSFLYIWRRVSHVVETDLKLAT